MTKGYWKFSREFMDHKLWSRRNCARIFILLMNEATHKKRTVLFNGVSRDLKPGQLLITRATIAQKLCLQPTSVWRSVVSLSVTEGDLRIVLEQDGTSYLITMCCWNSTQGDKLPESEGCDSSPNAGVTQPERGCDALTKDTRMEALEEGEGGATVAPEWRWNYCEAIWRKARESNGTELFDYTLTEWRQAYISLMASRDPKSGRPFWGRRPCVDALMGIAGRCDMERRRDAESVTRLSKPKEPWQARNDLKAAQEELKNMPGNPASGFVGPSDSQVEEFMTNRANLEKKLAASKEDN